MKHYNLLKNTSSLHPIKFFNYFCDKIVDFKNNMSDTNKVRKIIKDKKLKIRTKSSAQVYLDSIQILGRELAEKYADYYERKTRLKNAGRVAFKDSTMSKFYSAERKFENKYGSGIPFYHIDDAQEYANRVCKSKLWKELTKDRGYKTVTIRSKKRVSNAATSGVSYGHLIQLDPTCGMSEYVLLHELTHSAGYMHHDISYRKTLLKLVSRFMGIESAKRLKDEIKKAGLKMIVKSTIKSPEVWLQDYNKMKNLRKLARK